MVFIRISARIYKIALCCSKLCGCLIHKISKCLNTAWTMLCKRYSSIISTFKQKSIKKIHNWNLISFFQTAHRGWFCRICSFFAYCDYIRHITSFKYYICGQNLRRTCRIEPFKDIFIKFYFLSVHIKHSSTFRNRRICGISEINIICNTWIWSKIIYTIISIHKIRWIRIICIFNRAFTTAHKKSCYAYQT